MGRRHQERRVYPQGRSEVRAAAQRAVMELGLAVDPQSGEWEVRASQAMSAFSWGERISVVTATQPGGGTQVVVESKLAFGFVDWGRNQRNVEAILAGMDSVLDPGPHPDPHPDPGSGPHPEPGATA